MKTLYFFLTACFFSIINLQAQIIFTPSEPSDARQNQHLPHCGSDILMNQIDLQEWETEQEDARRRSRTTDEPDTIKYTIPVVFHIIHQYGPENIPDQNIHDAIKLLNDAFANKAPFDPARGVEVDVKFCFKNGENISRHYSPLTNVVMENDDHALKEIGLLDPSAYINIWVVRSIESVTNGPSVAGYAMLPYTHGAPFDGIVVEAAFMNDNPDDAKVLVHEMGHYLGLYHTFEGGCKNDDCLTDGDRVADTPPDKSTAAVICHSSANTCTTDEDDSSESNPFRSIALGGEGDQPDMHQNYMDYGFQPCQNTFTEGQRKRMRYALTNSRSSLLDNPGACLSCHEPVVASLDLPDVLPAGVPFTFTVTTEEEDIIWNIDNQFHLSSSVTRTFNEAATVPVQAIIAFNRPACVVELFDTVTFDCPVPEPVISSNITGLVSPGEAIVFETNGAGPFTWKADGTEAGSGLTLK